MNGHAHNVRNPQILHKKEFDVSMHTERKSNVREFKTEWALESSNEIDGCNYHESRAFKLNNTYWFVFDLRI